MKTDKDWIWGKFNKNESRTDNFLWAMWNISTNKHWEDPFNYAYEKYKKEFNNVFTEKEYFEVKSIVWKWFKQTRGRRINLHNRLKKIIG